MHIVGVGTVHPAGCYTKSECLEAFERSTWFTRLDKRAHFVARTVLQRENGIDARRLLEAALADDAAPGRCWLSSFGSGFSCPGALLEVQ
jgi:alkylresorcinol/alkylpyrone synthase